MIHCSWCDKTYMWDWDQDVVIGAKSTIFIPESNDKQSKGVELEVYFCSCGGTLAVATVEPKGGSLYEYRPESEIEDSQQ